MMELYSVGGGEITKRVKSGLVEVDFRTGRVIPVYTTVEVPPEEAPENVREAHDFIRSDKSPYLPF